MKKKAAVQPQNQQTVRQLIIQIVGFGLKNKKVVRCTAAIFTLLYLSLFGTCKLLLPLRPRRTLSFCYHRVATLQEKTISDAGGKIPPSFKVFFLLSVALYPVWLPCDTTPN